MICDEIPEQRLKRKNNRSTPARGPWCVLEPPRSCSSRSRTRSGRTSPCTGQTGALCTASRPRGLRAATRQKGGRYRERARAVFAASEFSQRPVVVSRGRQPWRHSLLRYEKRSCMMIVDGVLDAPHANFGVLVRTAFSALTVLNGSLQYLKNFT